MHTYGIMYRSMPIFIKNIIDMATTRKGQFRIYVDKELMIRMEELYTNMYLVRSNGMRKVKVSISRSKFWESVLRDYVDSKKDLVRVLRIAERYEKKLEEERKRRVK